MTIRKGEPWGEQYDTDSVSEPIERFGTLHKLAIAAYEYYLQGKTLRAQAFGDVLTPFGSLSEGNKVGLYPVDLGLFVGDDGESMPFVAHAVAKQRLWSGEFTAIMNTGWHGVMNLTPKAHLNDGLLDVLQGSLPLRQRLQAKKRAQSGTHLPHPSLQYKRCKETSIALKKTTTVYLDNEQVGRFSSIGVRVIPDTLLLVV